jgi:hypothetical protein
MIGFASAPHPTLSRRDVDRRDFFGRSKSRHPRFVDHCSSRRAHWGAEDPFVQDVLGAITSFRLSGKTSKADNDAVVAKLWDGFKVHVVRRAGVAKGNASA